jgi:hypothetical protein
MEICLKSAKTKKNVVTKESSLQEEKRKQDVQLVFEQKQEGSKPVPIQNSVLNGVLADAFPDSDGSNSGKDKTECSPKPSAPPAPKGAGAEQMQSVTNAQSSEQKQTGSSPQLVEQTSQASEQKEKPIEQKQAAEQKQIDSSSQATTEQKQPVVEAAAQPRKLSESSEAKPIASQPSEQQKATEHSEQKPSATIPQPLEQKQKPVETSEQKSGIVVPSLKAVASVALEKPVISAEKAVPVIQVTPPFVRIAQVDQELPSKDQIQAEIEQCLQDSLYDLWREPEESQVSLTGPCVLSDEGLDSLQQEGLLSQALTGRAVSSVETLATATSKWTILMELGCTPEAVPALVKEAKQAREVAILVGQHSERSWFSSRVLSYLNVQDLCVAASVCSSWRRLVAERSAWLKLGFQFVQLHTPDFAFGIRREHKGSKGGFCYPLFSAKSSRSSPSSSPLAPLRILLHGPIKLCRKVLAHLFGEIGDEKDEKSSPSDDGVREDDEVDVSGNHIVIRASLKVGMTVIPVMFFLCSSIQCATRHRRSSRPARDLDSKGKASPRDQKKEAPAKAVRVEKAERSDEDEETETFDGHLMIVELPSFYHGYQLMQFEQVTSSSSVATSAPRVWAQLARSCWARDKQHGQESVIEYLGWHHFSPEHPSFVRSNNELNVNRRGWYRQIVKGMEPTYQTMLLSLEGVDMGERGETEMNMLQSLTEQPNEVNTLLVLNRLIRGIVVKRREWLGGVRFHLVDKDVPESEIGSEGLVSSSLSYVSRAVSASWSSASKVVQGISKFRLATVVQNVPSVRPFLQNFFR